MDVTEIEPYPSEANLKAILDSVHVDIVSPFLSGWSLSRIKQTKHENVEIITRLPKQYHAPTAYLDNNPTPIKKAMDRMGARLRIYALPTVHAKLYINDELSWVGSANFTRNGFSKKQELLLRFDGQPEQLSKVFKRYKADAQLVAKADIEKLIRWCDLGLSKVRQKATDDGSSPDQAVQSATSFDDFVDWLAKPSGPKKSIRKHISDRVKGKNYMSGHIYPAFSGVLAYLRMKPERCSELMLLMDSEIPSATLEEVADFIRKYGDEYRGNRGGYWRRYLSTSLGGTQTGGGAGNTVVKKCLVLLPIYMRDRGLS